MNNNFFFFNYEKPNTSDMTIFIGKSFTDYGVDGILPEFGNAEAFLPIQDIIKRKKFKRVEQIFTLHDPCSVEINAADELGETEHINCIKKYISEEENKKYLSQYLFKKKIADLIVSISEDDSFTSKIVRNLFEELEDDEDWEELFKRCFSNIYIYLFEKREMLYTLFEEVDKEEMYHRILDIVDKRMKIMAYKTSIEFEICSLKYDGVNNLKKFLEMVLSYIGDRENEHSSENLIGKILFLKTPVYRIDLQSKSRELLLELVSEIQDKMTEVATENKTNIRRYESGEVSLQE
jgi:translation initiation factor 2 alpha subunit (eIF-2alpha)